MLTEFGQELRMIRLACGDRIFDMAEKLGVSPAYISRLEDYNDSPSNSNSLDELRQTLNKHGEKLDKLADTLGRVCEVINANTKRT